MKRSRQGRAVLITDAEIRGRVAASELPSKERQTLLAAVDGLDRRKLVITAAYSRIAGQLGLKRRATITRMNVLESMGVLVKQRGGGGRYENGRGRVNQWYLDLDSLGSFKRTPKKGAAGDTLEGAADCTVKGAVRRHQGCSGTIPRVQRTAQDQSLPSHQEKKSNVRAEQSTQMATAPPAATDNAAAAALPAASRRRRAADEVRPWVNRFASPECSQEERLELLRAQQREIEERNSQGLQQADSPVGVSLEQAS